MKDFQLQAMPRTRNCCLAFFLLVIGSPGGSARGQVLLAPPLQDEQQAQLRKDRAAEPKVITLRAAAEPDPALRFRFWPSQDQRRNASPHPFVSRATLMATQALAQDRDHEFAELYERLSNLPLEQLSSDETRQFLQRFAEPALNQLSNIDRLMDTTYDLQLEERSLTEMLDLLLPEVQEARQLARLLAVRARLALAEQRWDDMVDDLRVGFRLAETIGDAAPLLVSKLVGIAIVGVMLSVVEEAVQQPGCPNLYWALAAVPSQRLYQIGDALEFEVGNLTRVLPDRDALAHLPRGADAARIQLVSLALQLFKLLGEPSGGDENDDAAAARLIAGVYVVAMAEPSREMLAASSDWSQHVANLSAAEAVLMATRLRLLRTRDDWTKWNLLPDSLNINVEEKVGAKDFDPRSADVVTVLVQQLMPAFNAGNIAARRITQQHHLLMTLEAMRMHAAHRGELPKSLSDLHPVPALPDAIAQAPFDYQRISATTATLLRAPRWGGDSENILSIRIVTEAAQP